MIVLVKLNEAAMIFCVKPNEITFLETNIFLLKMTKIGLDISLRDFLLVMAKL